MRRLIALAALAFLAGAAPSQAQVFFVATCGTVPASQATLTAGNPGMYFVDTTGKLCVNATVSATATIAAFAPVGTNNAIAVTSTTARTALTGAAANSTTLVENSGATDVFVAFGDGTVTVTAANGTRVPAGWGIAFNIGTATNIAYITAGSTSTISATTGTGLPALGAAGSGGGGGGAITAAASSYAVGAFQVGTGADGWDATQGAKADAACAGGGSACSVSARLAHLENQMATVATQTTNTATNTAAAVPAGEFHIGEIGSNQIKVQVAQTVTAASAYTSGNAIGGKMTIAGAVRVSGALGAAGTGGILTGMQMNSKSLQTTQVDVFLFDADPSGSTCTDKTAFVLATADFDKVVGILTIPGTAANGAGWFGGGTGSVGIPSYLPVTYDLSSATSLFACAVTRGTPTFTATTDVSFKYNLLRN